MNWENISCNVYDDHILIFSNVSSFNVSITGYTPREPSERLKYNYDIWRDIDVIFIYLNNSFNTKARLKYLPFGDTFSNCNVTYIDAICGNISKIFEIKNNEFQHVYQIRKNDTECEFSINMDNNKFSINNLEVSPLTNSSFKISFEC